MSYNWVKKFIFFFCCDFIFLGVCYSWRYCFKYWDILFYFSLTVNTSYRNKYKNVLRVLCINLQVFILLINFKKWNWSKSSKKKLSCQKSEKNYHCYVEWWCKKLNWCLNKNNINVKVRGNINVDVIFNIVVDIRSNIVVDVRSNIEEVTLKK